MKALQRFVASGLFRLLACFSTGPSILAGVLLGAALNAGAATLVGDEITRNFQMT